MSASFTTTRADVIDALATISKSIPARNAQAELTRVRLSINGAVSLSSSDGLDFRAHATIPVNESSGETEVSIDAKELRKAAMKAPRTGEIRIVAHENALSIDKVDEHNSNTCSSVKHSPAELTIPRDTGGLRDPIESAVCEISALQLALALEQTVFASDDASTRWAINGVYVELSESGLEFVATDGRRLARVASIGTTTIDTESTPRADMLRRIVIPSAVIKRTILPALRHKSQRAGVVRVEIGLVSFAIRGESLDIVGAGLEGRFPNWRICWPDVAELPHAFECDVDRLAQSLESIVASPTHVAFHSPADCQLRVSRCEAVERLAIPAGADVGRVVLDPALVLDYLEHATGFVKIRHNGENAPVIFESAGAPEFILMPLGEN